MPEQRHFTHQEASDLTGLAVSTLMKYPFMTDLVRGEDFYVSRFARFRRRLYWTQRGIARLKTRSYRVFRDRQPMAEFTDDLSLPRRYAGTSEDETATRLTNTCRIVFTRYLATPCAVPNCPCMTHRLGLPQADVIGDTFVKRAMRKG